MNFNNFGFSENKYFWGMKILWIFLGSSQNWTILNETSKLPVKKNTFYQYSSFIIKLFEMIFGHMYPSIEHIKVFLDGNVPRSTSY